MENILLKLHYRSNFVEILVEDTDKCLLIDVLNDLYDEADKDQVHLPTNPSLAYSYEMNSITLKDDKDLMEMFSRLEGKKTIDIWIESEIEPSCVLLMARQVRANRKNCVQVSNAGNAMTIAEVGVSDSVYANVMKNGSEVRKPMKKLACKRHPSNIYPTTSVSLEVMVGQSSQTHVPKFKIARTTALRKGLYVPNAKRNLNEEMSERITRAARVDYGGQSDSEASDGEGSYIPSNEEREDEDDHSVFGLEVEDNLMLSTLDCIDDGYDPYDEHEWGDNVESYDGNICKNGELYDDKEFGANRLRPWQLFVDKEHFKDVLRDYCVQEGFNLVVVKAERNRYTAYCATANCGWRIHASSLPDGLTWAIKSIRFPDHNCVGVRINNPMANCAWVANKLVEDIRANPDISSKSIKMLLMERYGLAMANSSVYKSKDIALKEINGGHGESYKLLCQYCEMVKVTNPGSTTNCSGTHIMGDPERTLQFKSIFISFNAQFTGLIKGCRSLIGVDGTHLKGNYGGVLLSTVALDGNNELFPVAIGVVDSENKESWSNFFMLLKQTVNESGRTDWTIISDRQKGVEPALESVWPDAYRRFCARHLCKNFNKEYPGILMHKLFWSVVNATSEFTFKKALEKVVQHGGKGAGRWFLDLGDKEQWTKHKFNQISCDANTSNFVESFNSTLGVHRSNPILTLLEGVRRMVMVRHATR